mmetsp:Transcript_8359/g.52115  ORF Transcript_8359/g.52115 Transcript_8359/m.52115 type:complete len:85 (+) Transcript_8359:1902-2156(+)
MLWNFLHVFEKFQISGSACESAKLVRQMTLEKFHSSMYMMVLYQDGCCSAKLGHVHSIACCAHENPWKNQTLHKGRDRRSGKET